jgi:hypothetical protein
MCFTTMACQPLEKVQGDLLLAKRVAAVSGGTAVHAQNLCVLHTRTSQPCFLLEAM